MQENVLLSISMLAPKQEERVFVEVYVCFCVMEEIEELTIKLMEIVRATRITPASKGEIDFNIIIKFKFSTYKNFSDLPPPIYFTKKFTDLKQGKSFPRHVLQA